VMMSTTRCSGCCCCLQDKSTDIIDAIARCVGCCQRILCGHSHVHCKLLCVRSLLVSPCSPLHLHIPARGTLWWGLCNTIQQLLLPS
jgi:hypothetical protein